MRIKPATVHRTGSTPDGFHWDDFEEDFLQRLREHLKAGELDLLSQAEHYRARPSKAALQPVLKQATDTLINELTETADAALSIQGMGPALVQASQQQDLSEPLVASERSFPLHLEDHLWNVTLRTTVDPTVTEWVHFKTAEAKQRDVQGPSSDVTIDVSMAHPFVQRFLGPKNENAEVFLRLAVVLALSCLKFKRAGYSYASLVMWINRLLRSTASKEFP